MGWDGGYKHICQVIVEAQIEAVAGSDSISVASDWELFLLLALIIRQQPVPRSRATLLKFYGTTLLQRIELHSNTLEYTEIQWSLLCKNHCIGGSSGAFGCVPIVDILIGARLRELSDEMRWIDRNDEIDGIEKIDQIELISRRGSQHSFEHQLVKRPVKRQICQKLVKSWFDPAVQTAEIEIFVLGTQV